MRLIPADAVADWRRRAAALADELVAAGKLSAVWRDAVEATPRHLFVPEFYEYESGTVVRVDSTDATYADRVYANRALVTRVDVTGEHPVFLSSSSTPGLMTRMLAALDLQPGHRVLEIGTGSGYNVALLCHRLGAANVVSIDIAADLITEARARLGALGYRPRLLTGDGASGAGEHAPFDRIIVTCSVPTVPLSWIEETRIGGHILVDIRPRFSAGNLVRLTRTATDRAEGMFDAGQASFMAMRHAPGPYEPITRAPTVGRSDTSSTSLDPRTPWSNPVVWFLAALHFGGDPTLGYTGGDPRHRPDAVSITTPDGSRATIATTPGDDGTHLVTETGPERLWARVENAHRLWSAAGSPGWDELGLTVTPQRQTLFVRTPDRPIAVLGGSVGERVSRV